MKIYLNLFFFFSLNGLISAQAQSLLFELDNTIDLKIENILLRNAWAGGLNAPQFSKMDLDADGIEDWVVFDRTNSKIFTFLVKKKQNQVYQLYAPEYEAFFPPINGWMILQDFDGDGKKDIWTHATFGVQVWHNEGDLKWKKITSNLQTEGFKGKINLKVSSVDIPCITDMDEDGDLDILTFDFIQGNTIEFHQNLSQEKYKHSDSLIFKRITNCWAGIFEGADCGDFSFDWNCEASPSGGSGTDEVYRTLHIGSTLQILDINGDRKKDILIGDASCEQLYMMINVGTNRKPKFEKALTNFPQSKPLNFLIFPAIFLEDVNEDGIRDLIASPNLFYDAKNEADFAHSVIWYQNIGTEQRPNFQYQSANFLQNQMLDLGENAFPAFFDIDSDGDLDMLVGNKGKLMGGNFSATISLFENTGVNSKPVFQLKENDFLQLSFLNRTDIKPFFQDLDGDGRLDLCIVSSNGATTQIDFIPQIEGTTQKWNLTDIQVFPFSLGINDFPIFGDFDQDGTQDILVGKGNGGLDWYSFEKNIASTFQFKKEIWKENAQRRNLILSVADFDQDGNLDLITGDFEGKLQAYPRFAQTLLKGDSIAENAIFFHPLRQEYVAYPFGFNASPVTVDWNKDGIQELAVGTNGGGIQFVRNIFNPYEATPPIFKDFQLELNQTEKMLFVFSPIVADIEFYHEDKPTHRIKGFAQTNQKNPFELNGLDKGSYILEAKTKNGIILKRKFKIL